MSNLHAALELGCSTIGYGMVPLSEALARIAHLGFKSCEIGVLGAFCPHLDPLAPIDRTVSKCSEAAAKYGLAVSALNAAPRVYADPHDERALLDVVDRLLRVCSRLGCDLILDGGEREDPRDAAAARTTRVIREAFQRGRDVYGVTVTVEVPHREMLAATVYEAAWLLDLIAEPDLRITYDTSHATCGGFDVANGLKVLGERIARVQARDVRGDDNLVTPGDGEYEWEVLLAFLQCSPKPVFLELEFDGHLAADEVDREITRARSFIQSMWRQIACASE